MKELLNFLSERRGPIARNLLRGFGGLLVGIGLASDETVLLTPGAIEATGAAIYGATEAIYARAVKRGWTT